jgi:hypothetical protein
MGVPCRRGAVGVRRVRLNQGTVLIDEGGAWLLIGLVGARLDGGEDRRGPGATPPGRRGLAKRRSLGPVRTLAVSSEQGGSEPIEEPTPRASTASTPDPPETVEADSARVEGAVRREVAHRAAVVLVYFVCLAGRLPFTPACDGSKSSASRAPP